MLPPDDNLARIESNHHALLALCNLLEGIADSLPHRIDRQECLILSRSLTAMVRRMEDFEETSLFPVLLHWPPLSDEVRDTIERLKIEHQVDQCYAEEVEEMLRSYGEGRPLFNAETAGFMLRGFFESLRRHIAFEQQLLVPLLRLARRPL